MKKKKSRRDLLGLFFLCDSRHPFFLQSNAPCPLWIFILVASVFLCKEKKFDPFRVVYRDTLPLHKYLNVCWQWIGIRLNHDTTLHSRAQVDHLSIRHLRVCSQERESGRLLTEGVGSSSNITINFVIPCQIRWRLASVGSIASPNPSTFFSSIRRSNMKNGCVQDTTQRNER